MRGPLGLRADRRVLRRMDEYSANFQGTCSHHGGVAVWNDDDMKDQANQWCDDNPSLCENSHWTGIEGHGDHPGDTDDNDGQDR